MNRFEQFFFNFPHHFREKKSLDWFPFDSEERFDECLKKYPNSIHLENYLKNPIKYELNNYGFRTSDDFTLDGVGNVFLGCSHTFGVGHYLEDTWSYKLSQKIGGKFYNISEPSSGAMTQYRYLKYFSNKIKFKNVFHFLPSECWERFEYPFKNNSPMMMDLSIDSWESKKYMNWISDVLLTETFFNSNVMLHIDAIKNICKENGANYYLIDDTYYKKVDPYHKTLTPARDIEHYYVEEQHELFEKFYEKYKNNNLI